MSDLAFASATELAAAIQRKEVSSLELTELYIGRIEKYDGSLNAVVVRDFDRAREAARTADAALDRGESLGPLHGVPMTIKEAYDIEGLPTTWGIPEFKDNIADSDSESVRRLKNAGAHFIGKTNVPMNLADFQSFNDVYGTTNNPWDLTRAPGGSSGGSAAALAAGLTALEAGSDIGGSIRNPAHFCGIYGHKPTWGVVPSLGHALPGDITPPDIAVVGPMARSAADLALSMDIVAGADPANAAGWQLNLPGPVKSDLKEFRVAIWPTHELAPVATEMADRVQQTGDSLARLGATVSDTARPQLDFADCFQTYNSLLWGVMGAGLTDEEKALNREEAAALKSEDSSVAAYLKRYSIQEHGDWLQHSNNRSHIRAAWRTFFESWDILICPQMATAAFPHDHGEYLQRHIKVDNELQDYFQQVFWSGMITVAHLPSTVFPTGPSSDGLPIGLQAAGAEFNDYITIDFTRLLARELGGFVAPPGF
ncbi:MAG: amidase [Gammaproteobacteria bacterium]|nr:amidase [Gammaproteobacteria bacterium]